MQGEGRPPTTGRPASYTYATKATLPQQLRRRREAAHRSAPLEYGRRDPLDPPTGEKVRRCGIQTDEARRLMLVRGYGVAEILREEGMQPIYSRAGKGFVLDLNLLPDAVAILEWAGYGVRVRERGDAA